MPADFDVMLYNEKPVDIINSIWDSLIEKDLVRQNRKGLFVKHGSRFVFVDDPMKFLGVVTENVVFASVDAHTSPLVLPPYDLLRVMLMATPGRVPVDNDLVTLSLTNDSSFDVDILPINPELLPKNPILYLDTETSGEGPKGALDVRNNVIELIQINDGSEVLMFTPRNSTQVQLKRFFQELYARDRMIVVHNSFFDIPTIFTKTGLLPSRLYDTMLAEILMKYLSRDPNRYMVSLAHTMERHLGVKMDKSEQASNWGGEWTKSQLEYAYNDVKRFPDLVVKQVEKLNRYNSSLKENELGLRNRVARMEMATAIPVCRMVAEGVPINRAGIDKYMSDAAVKEVEAKDAFLAAAPTVENINSRVEIMRVLEPHRIKNTQMKTLEMNIDIPIVKLLVDYKKQVQVNRNLKKYKSSVVHPRWATIGSPPGRMKTSQPPVQNIPRSLKKEFYDPSLNLIRADYPAIELRICAQYVTETTLIDAFNNGTDLHKLTASGVLGVEMADVTKEQRQLAKSLNYGLLYGMGAQRFQNNANEEYGLSLSLEEASEYRSKFFEFYPALKEWHTETGVRLRQGPGAFFKTLYGRKAWYPEEDYTNALNFPIQGTGADMLKLALVRLWSKIKDDPDVRIINLIHDEIVLASKASKVSFYGDMLKEAMEWSAKLLLPKIETPVDVEYQMADNFQLGG